MAPLLGIILFVLGGFMVIKKVENNELISAIDVIWDTILENNLISFQVNEKTKLDYYKAIIEDCLLEKLVIIGAYKDNEIVGVITIIGNLIRHFYVRGEYQNQKIGKLLLSCVLSYLKDKKYSIVRLNSTEYAYEIYKKMGFVDSKEFSKYKYSMKYIMEE